MEHYRLRKHRGPEVWARVRLAYEAGETGPSVARRLDVGLANLRKKARQEGWSRRDQARRLDRELAGERVAAGAGCEAPSVPPEPPVPPGPPVPLDPLGVRRHAITRAASLLGEGRAGEAMAQLKTAEALARLCEATMMDPFGNEAEMEASRRKLGQIVEIRANELAGQMLAEGVERGVRWGGHALAWRARTFGAAAAEADWRRAEAEGWAGEYWDAEGRLLPREPGEMGW